MHHATPPAPADDLDLPQPATYVVDTNVILVANGQHAAASVDCSRRCARWLMGLMDAGRVALDEGYEILREYQHKTHASDGQGAGDVFVRWLLHHLDDAARCDLVRLLPHPQRAYEAFPPDGRLADFDASDRKFVALARTHPEAPVILQAADCKWLDWAPALADHGVRVKMLCEADMHQFHLHKFGV